MRRLGREEFARLMGACIEGVLEERGGLAPGEARRLRWEALRRFALRLESATPRVRALTKSECLAELERTHGALLRERLRQEAELAGLAGALAGAREAQPVQTLLPFEEGELEEALAADLAALAASADPGAEASEVLARERERRRALVARLVAIERERIDVLERRLAKLRGSQEEMERALAELARRAEIDGGLPSIYRTVQGLDPADGLRETKTALLTTLFEQNLDLQKRPA